MIKANILVDSLLGLMIITIVTIYCFNLITTYSKVEHVVTFTTRNEDFVDCEIWCPN